MIKFIKDRDLILDVLDYDLTLIGTTIKNSLGDGFQKKVKTNFPYVYVSNNETMYDDPKKLGTVRIVKRGNDDFLLPKEICPVFALCYITRGRYRPDKFPDAVDYDALRNCLSLINDNFRDKKIATTIIGYSKHEGGGDRERILSIMEEELKDCENVTVYDYEQKNYSNEDSDTYWNIVNLRGKISNEEKEKLMKKYYWERDFGIYTPMPDLGIVKLKKYIKEEKEKIKKIN